MDDKIKYFLCDTAQEVGELYGDNDPCNGFVRMPNEIYAVYNEKIRCIGFHEDAHIISYNVLSIPEQVFIREGLAMFFDKVSLGIYNQAWVSQYLKNGKYVSISKLINDEEFYKYSDVITYPIAGCFTEYIISIFGIEKFKEFYKTLNSDFSKCFIETFGTSLNKVEEEFIDYINSVGVNDFVMNSINNYLNERNL